MKINDKVILGLVVGFVSNVPKTLLCLILNKKGISKLRCSDLSASLFIHPKKVFTKKGRLFGILCDFITASFAGVVYIYFLFNSGKISRNNSLIKGLLCGIFNFVFLRGIVKKVGTKESYPEDIQTNLILGMNSTLWGIVAGLLVPHFAGPELTENE